jgi:hypothetical protein
MTDREPDQPFDPGELDKTGELPSEDAQPDPEPPAADPQPATEDGKDRYHSHGILPPDAYPNASDTEDTGLGPDGIYPRGDNDTD